MSNDVKLEPCPFCGGPAQIIAGAPGCYYVRCEGCSVTSDDGSRERVITKWNTRHQPQREAVLEEAARFVEQRIGNTFLLAEELRALKTTPAPAVTEDDQVLLNDIFDKMEEVLKPLPGEE